MRKLKPQLSRVLLVVITIASLVPGRSSAQERNIPIPGFVLRDATGALVGQILAYPNQVLVSAGGDKAVFEIAEEVDPSPFPHLTGPSVYYPEADCQGAPMMSLLESEFETKLRGASYGIGASGVVHKITSDSLACATSESASRSGSWGRESGSCIDISDMGIGDCRMAEASAIDLSEVEPPFRIE